MIAVELCKAGASALLPKSIPASELIDAIQRVTAGQAIFPAQSVAEPDLVLTTGRAHGLPEPSLTSRQTQVLKFIAEGMASKEIADQLSISAKTVEKHRQTVKRKLRVHKAAELTRRAIGLGLVRAN